MQLQQSKTSLLMMGLLTAVMGLSGCQKSAEPEATDTDTTAVEKDVPMSAEPAEHDDPTAAEVADDTVATVVTPVISQASYLCSPELEFSATYNDEADQVTLKSAQGEVTLAAVGEDGDNFEATKSLDGGAGLTQWRVAEARDNSGVLRVSAGEGQDVTAYNCDAVDETAAN
jgi:hypothetical protein